MIYISNNNNIKKILLETPLKSSDIELFSNSINQNDCINYEITFIDIAHISSSMLKLLAQIKNKAIITSTKRTLWLYLTKLGIKCNYKDTIVEHSDHTHAIAIGGSAGSIEKIISIVKNLSFSDISIFIVVHILPDKVSKLDDILQKYTNYKVYTATNMQEIKNGCIYIAPPDYHMEIKNKHIFLNKNEKVNYSRPSIDVTFKSLAYEYKNSLMSILLCGYGKDGSLSLQTLKDFSSEIIIQDPNDCEAKDMPLNAIKTNNYTKILNLKQIEHFLQSTLNTSLDFKSECDNFLENLYIIYGYDFRNYDKNSIIRRIEITMQTLNIKNFKSFERQVFQNERVFGKLLKAFSINVTEFFRNPETFKSIREEILKYLQSYVHLKIWCAGCSKGDEPYSLAILLDEMGLLNKTQIYATDFNPNILQEAENGLFELSLFEKYEKNYHQSGGKNDFKQWFNFYDDFFEVKDYIKNKILFFKHNLVTDSSINEFNLILCRNVLIYFDKTLQKKVFNTIDDSLFRNGFLVLGESEVIDNRDYFKIFGDKKNKIYKKEYV